MVDPYDALGHGYADHVRTAPYNALYERPALLGALGDVAGADVVDLGCGPGLLAEVLLARGARVVGLERSAAQLDLARERLGDRVALHRHDLTDPLPVDDATADVAVLSLVLHYLEDWAPVCREIARVLRPGGRVVASVHHPFRDRSLPHLAPEDVGDYLASWPIDDEWHMGGRTATVRYWHHPLGRMTGWFTGAGLVLTGVDEPRPAPEAARSHPEVHARLSAEPAFLLLSARRDDWRTRAGRP